jgi:hypothetical protein
MKNIVQAFLFFEAATFVIAALIHSGVLVAGYEHPQARIAESVIAAVLLIGLISTWIRPAWMRKAGLAAQGFALIGTLVGVFTIIVGVGPQTAVDIIYHVAIIIVLICGLLITRRRSPDGS